MVAEAKARRQDDRVRPMIGYGCRLGPGLMWICRRMIWLRQTHSPFEAEQRGRVSFLPARAVSP